MARADDGELWIGEGDGERGASLVGQRVGVERRVRARDASLVGGFVEQRALVVHVAREEDGRVAHLHRGRVKERDAARVELDAGALEGEPLDVGASARGGDDLLERLAARVPLRGHPREGHGAVVIRFEGRRVGEAGACLQVELLAPHGLHLRDHRLGTFHI